METATTSVRPTRRIPTADELLNQRVSITLKEFSSILGIDRATTLRQERAGLLPQRRMLGGRSVFLTSDVKDWLTKSPVGAVDPDRSRKSREIALARAAKTQRAA